MGSTAAFQRYQYHINLNLGGDVSVQETDRAEALLLDWLKKAEHPLDPAELQTMRAREDAAVSSDAIRYAVWDLVDKGKAEFTDDLRLVAK